MMKFISKLAIIILAVVFFSCGEELYDTASRYAEGINLITALVQGASGGDVIVTDGRDYFRQWSVATAPTGTERVFMDRRGRVYVAQGSGVIYVYSGTEGWRSTPGPGIIYGFANWDNESAIVLGEDLNIFGYSDGVWEMVQDLAVVASFYRLFTDQKNNIYLVKFVANILSYHYLGSPVDIQWEWASTDLPMYSNKVDGIFYAGYSSKLLTSETDPPKQYSPPGNISAYAVINSNAVFSGGLFSGQLALYRLDKSDDQFKKDFEFTSITGNILLDVLDEGTLVVGVSGESAGSGANGLYLYSIASKSMKKISPLPVFAIHVRNNHY